MNLIVKIILLLTLMLTYKESSAQINNQKTETVKILGVCGNCKMRIEKTGNLNKIVKVNWNKYTQTAIIKYDSTVTNKDEILKRISLVGHDNELFLAPDSAYLSFPTHCQYERLEKKEIFKIN
tara:strand:- start:1398 stop:1766 length:369 start_codon:yes stop_codon:yes gene_type:complete